MKNSIYIVVVLIICILFSCKTSKHPVADEDVALTTQKDTIRIANDSLQYEVIIIDTGFNYWLNSKSYPRNYHSQSYLENKNEFYINEWNRRVMEPQRFDPNLYEMNIDYNPNTNYGYEVNYLIYNYMIFFQNTYKQKLDGHVPTR